MVSLGDLYFYDPPPEVEAGLAAPNLAFFDFPGQPGTELVSGATWNDGADLEPFNPLNLYPTLGFLEQFAEVGTAGAVPTLTAPSSAASSIDTLFGFAAPFSWLETIWILDPSTFAALLSYDFGFVLAGVTKQVLLFSTYSTSKSISAVDLVQVTGLTTNTPIPYVLNPGASLLVTITVGTTGTVSLQGSIVWVVLGAEANPNLDITGTRALVFKGTLNWEGGGPRISFGIPDDVFAGDDDQLEQRTTPARVGEYLLTIEARYSTLERTERRRLYNDIRDVRSRPAMVPFYTEELRAAADAAAATVLTIVNSNLVLADLLYTESMLLVRFDKLNFDFFEARTVSVIGASTITVASAFTASVPVARQFFHFVAPCALENFKRKNLTDVAADLELTWRGL